MPIDKNFYNESSAKNLGWEPSWFGEKYFDDKLVRAIKKWQKARGIASDGLCGPMTYRRLWTERQADIGAGALQISMITSQTTVHIQIILFIMESSIL